MATLGERLIASLTTLRDALQKNGGVNGLCVNEYAIDRTDEGEVVSYEGVGWRGGEFGYVRGERGSDGIMRETFRRM